MKNKIVWFGLGLLVTSSFAFIPRRIYDYSSPENIEREFSNFSISAMKNPVITDRVPTANDKMAAGSLWLETVNRSLYMRSETTDNGWYQVTSGTQPEIPAQNRPTNRFRHLNSIASVFTSSHVAASGTAKPISFVNELEDTDSIHSTTTNTGRLTVPIAGKYAVTGYAFIDSIPGSTSFFIAISTNQCVTLKPISSILTAAGIDDSGLSVTAVRKLGINEYVELCLSQNSGLNQTVEAEFSMFYMGE